MEIVLPYELQEDKKERKTAILEALLFLSGQPLTGQEIVAHTGWTMEQVIQVARELQRELQIQQRGIILINVAGGYQLATDPTLYEQIHWVKKETKELSTVAMEVLAIVAFKQPITRVEIEQIRGVSSERILGTLIHQGLIVDLGRKEVTGRPIMYGTSPYFLECLGINSVDELVASVNMTLQKETREDMDGTITQGDE